MSSLRLDNGHDVFVCHNRADKDWARNLAERLERETIDGTRDGRPIRAFWDEWDIEAGENIVNRLNEGLKKSRFLAVVLSPEFLESGWTNLEWTHWVATDPSARSLIPVLHRDVGIDGHTVIDLPAPFRATSYLDFREKTNFERMFQRLLARVRGLKSARGNGGSPLYSGASLVPVGIDSEPRTSWEPDREPELILGNMLKVTRLPRWLWSGRTDKTDNGEVYAVAPGGDGFVLREGRLWSFSELTNPNNALRLAIDVASIRSLKTAEWLGDSDRQRWLIALMNQCLKNHLYWLGIGKERRGRFFFKPTEGGGDRVLASLGDRARTVAAKKKNQASKATFWVHHAARIKFERLGDHYFLNIDPTFLFTEDGKHPFEGDRQGRLVMMWGGRQRNDSIIRNLVFWAKIVAKGRSEVAVRTGGEPIVVSGWPASAQVSRGIECDEVKIRSLLNIGETEDELESVAQDVEIVEADEEGDVDESET